MEKGVFVKTVDWEEMRTTSMTEFINIHLPEYGAMKIVPNGRFADLLNTNCDEFYDELPTDIDGTTLKLSEFGNEIFDIRPTPKDILQTPQLADNSTLLSYNTLKVKLEKKWISTRAAKSDNLSVAVEYNSSMTDYLSNNVADYPDGWNFNKLPIPNAFNSNMLLESSGSLIPLTIQPFDLPKASLLLPRSHSKLWVIIDPDDQFKVNNFLTFHREWSCKSPLSHGRSLITLEKLKDLKVKYWNALQNPGEIIVLGSGACFQSIAGGPSLSEEVFFYEKPFFTRSLQRNKCICFPVLKIHEDKKFDNVRSISSLVEEMNYETFNGQKKECQPYTTFEDQIVNDASTSSSVQSFGSRQDRSINQHEEEIHIESDAEKIKAPVYNPTGRPLFHSKKGKGWTKSVPLLKGGVNFPPMPTQPSEFENDNNGENDNNVSQIVASENENISQTSQHATQQSHQNSKSSKNVKRSQNSSLVPSNATPIIIAPSPMAKETTKRLKKRKCDNSRYRSLEPEEKKRKQEKRGKTSRNATNPGSIFFQRQVDLVQQRLLRILRDLEIYNKKEKDPDADIKMPERTQSELQTQHARDTLIKENLIKDRDQYNILKQIYCRSQGTLKANLSIGIDYNEIIRLFFDYTSKTNQEIWDLSVDNAIRDKVKQLFYKNLIKNAESWEAHFKISHGVRIPWREWSEIGQQLDEEKEASFEILKTLKEDTNSDEPSMSTAEQKTTKAVPKKSSKRNRLFLHSSDSEPEPVASKINRINDHTGNDYIQDVFDASSVDFSVKYLSLPRNQEKKFGRNAVPGKYLKTLLPGYLLSNFVVDEYMQLIEERNISKNGIKCHTMRTFDVDNKKNALPYLRRTIMNDCDYFLIPILKNIHFILFVADFKLKQFSIYNSLKGNISGHRKSIDSVADFVKIISSEFFPDLSLDDWKEEWIQELPLQQNGIDCGVFVCEFASKISNGIPISTFDVNAVRRRIAFELLDGVIVDDTDDTVVEELASTTPIFSQISQPSTSANCVTKKDSENSGDAHINSNIIFHMHSEKNCTKTVMKNGLSDPDKGDLLTVDSFDHFFEDDMDGIEIFVAQEAKDYYNSMRKKYTYNPYNGPSQLSSRMGNEKECGARNIKKSWLVTLQETEKMYFCLMINYFNLILERNLKHDKYLVKFWYLEDVYKRSQTADLKTVDSQWSGTKHCIFNECRFLFSLMTVQSSYGDHVGLMVFDTKKKLYFFYDPSCKSGLGTPEKFSIEFNAHIRHLKSHIQHLVIQSTKESFNWEGWKNETPFGLTLPSTLNNKEYNFFICLFAEQFARGVLDIRVDHPKERREMMLGELLDGKLFKPI